MADNQYISPFVSNGDTFRSANKTSYDITNKEPVGGPINDSESGFSHTYTPSNKYLDNFQSEASNNSAFGIEGNEVLNNNIFKKTKLDIEDPEPIGGPNRTNIPNIPGGTYINTKTSNINGLSPYPGGTLKNKDGSTNKVMIQRWNNKNTYTEFMRAESLNLPNETKNNNPLPELKGKAKNSIDATTKVTQGAISPLGGLPI